MPAAALPLDGSGACYPVTAGRTALVAVMAAVGFIAGFYAGLVVLLSIVGLEDFRGWQFPLATVPSGGVVGGVAAGAATVGRPWMPVLASAAMGGLVAMGIVYLVDGDFGVAIILGTTTVTAAATTAAARSAPRHRHNTG